jgi:Zn-dependent peptidase ImmA (M78 family)
MTPRASKVIPLAEAARIWSLYGFTSPKELILEDLAMAMNIFVVDARLDSAAARLVRKGDYGLIRVNDGLRFSGQRRFAIAHEIGHFVMHQTVSQLLACTDADLRASYRSSPYEIEASIFAGALLMPSELFQSHIASTVPTTTVIKNLASEFDTSLTATAMRYAETSSDYCVFVVSENNTIRWWRASESFGNHGFWLDSKSELPRHSAAAAYFRDGEAPDEPIEVDLTDWFGEMEDIDSDYVLEQAIPLPEFGQVISMIWLP